MAKRDSWQLIINCRNEHHRNLLYEAIMTLKDIQHMGEDSKRIPPFLSKDEVIIWAKATIVKSIERGVWWDQEEGFQIQASESEDVWDGRS